MKILVTGSRGFVGDSFGRFAAAAGHEVLGVSRSSQPDPDWPGHHLQADAAQTDMASLLRDFQPDLLLQAAGSASVAASLQDPVADFRATAVTLTNILDSVRRSGTTPVVIFPSSAAVYGNPERLPVGEEAPLRPISPYGFHKAACETLAEAYARCFGLTVVVCRIFSLFGSRQRRLLVYELFQQLAGPAPTVEIQGTGRETRDFLPMDDLARAFLGLAEAAPRGASTILNAASGTETPILRLAETMRAALAPEKEIICHGRVRAGDPHHWCAEVGKLRALLPAWKPQELAVALRETMHAWQPDPRP